MWARERPTSLRPIPAISGGALRAPRAVPSAGAHLRHSATTSPRLGCASARARSAPQAARALSVWPQGHCTAIAQPHLRPAPLCAPAPIPAFLPSLASGPGYARLPPVASCARARESPCTWRAHPWPAPHGDSSCAKQASCCALGLCVWRPGLRHQLALYSTGPGLSRPRPNQCPTAGWPVREGIAPPRAEGDRAGWCALARHGAACQLGTQARCASEMPRAPQGLLCCHEGVAWPYARVPVVSTWQALRAAREEGSRRHPALGASWGPFE